MQRKTIEVLRACLVHKQVQYTGLGQWDMAPSYEVKKTVRFGQI